jgi:hypothetical protein
MGFLWGTDKPIELGWALNKRQDNEDRPDLSSEKASQIRQDCNFQKQNKKFSGQKSQIGLDTKIYWPTDCQL